MASIFLRALPKLGKKPLMPCMVQQGWLSNTAYPQKDISRVLQENQKAREDLALAYRSLEYNKMQEGVCNHLTMRAPAKNGCGDVMLLIKHGVHWSEVTASSLLGLDFKTGEVIEGEGEVEFTANNIHRAIHNVKAADGIKCVMHTHQPYTTALACIKGGRLMNIHQNCLRFHNKISYDESYGGFGDCEESESIAKAFDGKDICFMANHGVAAVGKRVCDVFDDLYYLERGAMFQILAMSTGQELLEVPDDVAEATALENYPAYSEVHFESMRAVIAKLKPDYRS